MAWLGWREEVYFYWFSFFFHVLNRESVEHLPPMRYQSTLEALGFGFSGNVTVCAQL
jgi:hypothetical protein